MGAWLKKMGKGGNYFAVFYDGKRQPKWKSVPLKTTLKSAAQKKFSRWVEDYEHGRRDPWTPDESAPAERLTVKQAIERFLTDRAHLRPKTLQFYRQELGAIELPPNLMLSDLSADHLRPYVYAPKKPKQEDGKPAKPVTTAQATKRKRYTCLRTFVRWCMKAGLLGSDPLEDVPQPKPGEKVPRFLSVEDVEKLLASIDYATETSDGRTDIAWLRDMVVLAVNTGLRSGELRNLRWSDVDLENGLLEVRNRERFQTKSGAERRVPVVGDALAVLARLNAARPDASADGLVITGRSGEQISTYRLSHSFKRYVRLARLDDRFRFHDTRHTCGSWLAMKGVSLRVIQQILGHKTITTTEIYSHLSPNVVRDAMERTFGAAGRS